MAQKKLTQDLGAKKRELVQVTTENNTLKNKIKDLEAKLAKFKRAA